MNVPAIFTNTSDLAPYISDEMGSITELHEAGVIEQLNVKAERSGAVIIVEAQSAEDAQRQLATLPWWSLAWRA
jgi:hypothetical protein